MEEALKQRYFREYQIKGGRTVRGLTLAGFNLIRSMIGLEEASPAAWLAMTPEQRHDFRLETLMRSTPELATTLFGGAADLENCPIDE